MHTVARIAEPLPASTNILGDIQALVTLYSACGVVVGTPRGLDGQDTAQTKWAAQMLSELRQTVPTVTFFEIDEAGTTKEAETRRHDERDSVDSLAACILLEDFIAQVERGKIDDVTI